MKKYFFPTTLYKQIITEKDKHCRDYNIFYHRWRKIRNQCSANKQEILDENFKVHFESLIDFFWRKQLSTLFEDTQKTFIKLKELVERGASAKKLGNYELGPFNVAMAIKSLDDFAVVEELELAYEIVRFTILVDSNLVEQKAYAGNGGASSIYWLIEHATHQHRFLTDILHDYCYELICLMLDSPLKIKEEDNNLLLFCLVRDACKFFVSEQHKKIAIRIMTHIHSWTSQHFSLTSIIISIIQNSSWELLPILLPTDQCMKTAIVAIKNSLTLSEVHKILNAFTLNAQGRKHFKNHFSHHWLLKYILDHYPEAIFHLVKRREKVLLEAFLKKHREEITILEDVKGNSLLHAVASCHGRVENIIAILIDAGVPTAKRNKQGKTAYDIAVKKNKNFSHILYKLE